MLKDKVIHKLPYDEAAILCAHLKNTQARAVVLPHTRKEGKSLELLLCDVLKSLAKRLDAALFDYKVEIKVTMNRREALAFHCAYKYDWIPAHLGAQTIFEAIDRVI